MNLNLCLFGATSSGKSSLINIVNCNFNLKTDKDHTALEDGKSFKDYVNNSPIRPDVKSLFIRDTDGDIMRGHDYKYMDTLNDWIDNKTDDIHKDNIVFYVIDLSMPFTNDYEEHINNIKLRISTVNKHNTFIKFYVICNKVDRITYKKLLNNLGNISKIYNNFITMSCNDTFLNVVKKLKLDVPLQNTDYSDARQLVKYSRYKLSKELKSELKEGILKHYLLEPKDDDDEKDKYGKSLFDIIRETHTQLTTEKVNCQLDMFEQNLSKYSGDYKSITQPINTSQELDSKVCRRLEECIINVLVSKTKTFLDRVTNSTSNNYNSLGKIDMSVLLQLQQDYNYHFIGNILFKFKEHLDFKTLFESLKLKYDHDLCNMVIKNNQIYELRCLTEFLMLETVPRKYKYYVSVMNLSINDIQNLITLDTLDYKTLDKILNTDSKFYFKYICNHTQDMNSHLYESSVNVDTPEYTNFYQMYTFFQTCKDSKKFDSKTIVEIFNTQEAKMVSGIDSNIIDDVKEENSVCVTVIDIDDTNEEKENTQSDNDSDISIDITNEEEVDDVNNDIPIIRNVDGRLVKGIYRENEITCEKLNN